MKFLSKNYTVNTKTYTLKCLLEHLEATTENVFERISKLRPKVEELSNKIEVFLTNYFDRYYK